MVDEQDSKEKHTLQEYLDIIHALEKTEAQPGQQTILVVDDEPSVRRMVSRSITSLNKDLKVIEAENGQHALESLQSLRDKKEEDPVMIVTDLQMPIMDGWELIDRLWEDCQKNRKGVAIPLIVLSSSSGVKGMFFGKSVHGEKCKYSPVVSIAKEDCIKPRKYDAQGEKGLVAWLKYFLRSVA
jgi:CheY-like chemotaxis protein